MGAVYLTKEWKSIRELPNPMLMTESLRRELRAELLSRSTLADIQTGAGVILGGAELGAASVVWPGIWYGIGCGGGLILAGFLVAAKLR